MSESSTLLGRKNSVRFSSINTDQEANLEHAATDFYESLMEDAIDSEMDEDVIWLREQRDLNKSLHWIKRPSLLMVGFVIFLFAFGNSAGDSTRKIIVFKLGCNALIRDGLRDYCDPNLTEILLSNVQLAETILTSIMAFIAMPKIGTLSDQYGRKPFIFSILMSYLIGKGIKYYLVVHYDYLKFWCLVLSEVICFTTGGLVTFISLANCYVSDIAEIHQRSYFIGVAIAFFFSGVSLGPICGNLLLEIGKSFKKKGTGLPKGLESKAFVIIESFEFYPLKFELVSLVFLVVFVGFVLPESRSHKARRKSRSLSISQSSDDEIPIMIPDSTSLITKTKSFFTDNFYALVTFFKPVTILYIPLEFKPVDHSMERFRRERVSLIFIVLIDCISASSGTAMGQIYALYGILKYNWNATTIGYFIAVACGVRAILLIFVSPLLNHHVYHKFLKFQLMKRQFDMIDFSNTFLGLFTEMIACIGFILAPNTQVFLMWVCFSSFSSFVSPNLNSAILKYYPDSKTGEVLAAVSLIKNIFILAVPVVFLTVYKYALAIHYPELIFVALGVTSSILFAMLIFVKIILSLASDSVADVLSRTNSFSRINSRTNSIHSRNNSSEFEPINVGELHRKNSNISQFRK